MEPSPQQTYFNKLTLQRLRLLEIVALQNHLERMDTINAIARNHGVDTGETRHGLRILCKQLLSLIDSKMVTAHEMIAAQNSDESVVTK